jgi:hypothetical protein
MSQTKIHSIIEYCGRTAHNKGDERKEFSEGFSIDNSIIETFSVTAARTIFSISLIKARLLDFSRNIGCKKAFQLTFMPVGGEK